MLAHDWLDSFCGFIGVIKRNGGDEVVENMGLDNPVKELATNKSKFTIDGRCSSASKVPGMWLIMRKRWICVLEECDCDFEAVSNFGIPETGIMTYQAND